MLPVPRILVVDDHPDERRILATVLYYNGYDVVEAASGREAVVAAAEARPDLILMDLRLPDMTGFLAAEIIRTGLGFIDIPVICVTGMDVPVERARERGCADVLYKPVYPEDLVRAVHRQLPMAPPQPL